MEAGKSLEVHPSRTSRRMGNGTCGQSDRELERPTSARAKASRVGVGAGHSTAGAGRQHNFRRGKGWQSGNAEYGEPFGDW